jgi:hypothetical protein
MVLTSIPLIRHDAGYDINSRRHNNLVGLVKMRCIPSLFMSQGLKTLYNI